MSSALTEEEFSHMCEFSASGRLSGVVQILVKAEGERNFEVGSATFCLDPKEQKGSPLVLAERYPAVIDVDHVATIATLARNRKVACVTALWAASIEGQLAIVKMLISRGADVNKATLTGSTPLRGASYSGHVEIMQYLLENGANINSGNCMGQSPLTIAAMKGDMAALGFLLDNGADFNQASINGYTVMHQSAFRGKEGVVRCLLSAGMSPMFQQAHQLESYIPCPLFLAAAANRRAVVYFLMDLPQCPFACKSDALLLLGAAQCGLDTTAGLTMDSRNLWSQALQIREENDISPNYVEPVESFGQRTEMRDANELTQLSIQQDFLNFEAYCQCLLIFERCLGSRDQAFIYFLVVTGSYFCQDLHKFREAERLWFRVISEEVEMWEGELRKAQYGLSEGLKKDMERDVSRMAAGVCCMVHHGYKPEFSKYVQFGLKELEILLHHKRSSPNGMFLDVKHLLGMVLYVLASWVYWDTKVAMVGGNKYVGSTLKSFTSSGVSEECELLGRQFVSDYLREVQGSTLLHYSLTNFPVDTSYNELIYNKYKNLGWFIDVLLVWGCYQVLDLPDEKGLRPVHIAAMTESKCGGDSCRGLMSILIHHGVHVDAVSREGKTVFEVSENAAVGAGLRGCRPVALTCLAARSVVRYEHKYRGYGLPLYLQSVVEMHDKSVV